MPSIAFPSTPIADELYIFNGITYQWIGNAWRVVADIDSTQVTHAATTVDVPLNQVGLRGVKNFIQNGDFSLNQRGVTSFADSTYGPDRFYIKASGGATADYIDITDLSGFCKGIEVDRTSGAVSIMQPLELPEAGDPGVYYLTSRFVFSFYVKAAQITQLSLVTGFADDSSGLNNADFASPILADAPAGVWTRVIGVINIGATPNPTNQCLQVGVSFDGGTSCQITGWQLERSTPKQNAPTSYEYIDAAFNKIRCERFYETTGTDILLAYAQGNTGTDNTTGDVFYPYKTEKRVAPTVVETGLENATLGSVTNTTRNYRRRLDATHITDAPRFTGGITFDSEF